MLELGFLLLLIAVAFGWSFFIGLTEKKTGKKSILGWPFVLTYWYGKGKPKPETETKTIDPHAQPEPETLTKNIENLNNSILLLIQKLEERQKSATKKTIVKEPEKTNQGE
jgi:hypothetical protein